jgi:hypothetical protein
MDGTRGRLVYKISVESLLCDPIRGSGSLPAEGLKWMSNLGILGDLGAPVQLRKSAVS